ncbi:MAG: 4Fe-4S binding protein [Lachnospiraceae bacterium]|nr:4Fe-4S binding protein [Lachnospiraceae bacterium]
MGAVTDRAKCIGCGRCIDVCPGNVIRKDEQGKAYLKYESDCWSCAACVKECPMKAIYLRLPPEYGGTGADMYARKNKNITTWEIVRADGEVIRYTTDTEEANKY